MREESMAIDNTAVTLRCQVNMFRGDLDPATQLLSVAAYHRAAADDLNHREWQKTMMYRKDHYAMVMMLFGEAIRHNPTRFTNAEKKDIVGKLKLMMGEGQRRDCYVDALHYLSSLNLFERNPRTSMFK